MKRADLRSSSLLTVLVLLPLVGCGPGAGGGASASTPGRAVADTSDLPPLGLALADCSLQMSTGNGLAGNGICQNGLSLVGLDLGHLDATSFATWFDANPALADMLVRYFFRCAAPAEQTVTWTSPTTGVVYSWTGGLGLAPDWMAGAPPSEADQQVVSACLGALVNRYGVHVTVAVEGRDALGSRIAMSPGELATFPVREGCFFGNLFTGEGLFLGPDHPAWPPEVSSSRGCTTDPQAPGPSLDCPPMYNVGDCASACTLDWTGTFYERCTVNGVSYRPLVTRIQPADLFTCGDGVCQVSEHCGTGTSATSCQADCGVCP